MKNGFIILLLLFQSLALLAQSQTKAEVFTGVIIDSVTNRPMPYVTVAGLSCSTNAATTSTLTKADGTFKLAISIENICRLQFVSVGYEYKTLMVNKADSEVNFGNIILKPITTQLKEVAIAATRPVMKQGVDRLTYDVQADPESKVLNGLDLLRKVPLLSVDANEAIKLKGSSSYKILINGKESNLMTKNPSDILKSMPAGNIEKIEVITTPPAKYDGEGLAGIINIITKKTVGQGYTVSLNAHYNSLFGPGFSANVAAKQGKFGLSVSTNYNKVNAKNYLFSNVQQFGNGNTILQTGDNLYGRNTKYLAADLSYDVDSLNLITGTFNISATSNQSYSNTDLTALDNRNQLMQAYQSSSAGIKNYNGTETSINYQRGFKNNKNQLLTFSYKYSDAPNHVANNNYFFNRINFSQALQPDFNQDDRAGSKENTLQIDYVHPLKNIIIEAGTKGIFRHNNSDYAVLDRDSATNKYQQNYLQSDLFNYHQNIYSLYNSYEYKFTSWSIKAGLRLEQTDINANFITSEHLINQRYNNLIPSIAIQKKLGESSLNFGYTQRIQRPGITQLNPYFDNSDPKFTFTGNPALRPELDNTFEFNYSRFAKNNLNIGLSYAFSDNAIQTVTNLQTVSNGKSGIDTITNTTYQNLGINRTLAISFNTNFTLTSALSATLNGRLAKVWLEGVFESEFYKNSGYSGTAFGNINYKFSPSYRMGVDAGFISSNVTLQGTTSSYIYSSLSASKDFFNKKATLSFVGTNLFKDILSFHLTTNTPAFRQEFINNNPYRTLTIKMTYNFGKLNNEIRKNKRGINNDDIKGS